MERGRASPTPIDFEIDEAAGLVRSTGRGILTGKELVEFGRRLFNAPELPSPYRGICDLREVKQFEGSAAGIRALADLARDSLARAPGGRLAFVTSSASVYGLSRMYEMMSDAPGFEVRVFEADVDAALRWLSE